MRTFTTATVLAATTALATAAALASPGVAAESAPRGTTSIAEVLAADGLKFDKSWNDFDILDRAVNDVLAAKPESPVGVLADGGVKLTAFAPTDRAFRQLVTAVAGSRPATEKATYAALGTVGVDTIESVLLYHVVPGAPITAKKAAKADGAKLTTAAGTTVRVDYRPKSGRIFLIDKDRNSDNASVIARAADINKGNRQIAHGIRQVLRPFDL